MSVIAVARRYAEALADVTIARNQTEQVEQELQALTDMLDTSAELRSLFASPTISQAEKGRVLDAIINRTGPSQTTANLLKTLLSHYRLGSLKAIYDQFRREMNDRKGIVPAEVTTSAPISLAEQEALAQKLRAMTGKRIQLQFKTDPSLIGGVVTRIGSVVYDGSIRTQLQSIKQLLKQGAA